MTFNLDIPKMGHFILYRHAGGLIGNIIRARQLHEGFSPEDSAYTHIEVSGGGQHTICVEPPKSYVADIKKKHLGRYVKIMKYYTDDYDQKRYKIAFWAATKCNLPYDFFGVISFVWKVARQANGKYFCSENALWALQQQYHFALDMKPENCMPAHFLKKPYFECVWEGIVT